MLNVLIVEDGHEYIETMSRYLSEEVSFVRAGDGVQALTLLDEGAWDVVFMDMRFDRSERLLGEDDQLRQRFGSDAGRVRRFLERHQGTYIANAIREAGHSVPILFSYDFDGEPARWTHLSARLAPAAYVNDTASPASVRAALRGLCDG